MAAGILVLNRFGVIAFLALLAIIGVLIALLFPLTRTPLGGSAVRSWCSSANLKQIALALHSYHDKFGCFPPAYVADKNGRPTHSWRVLILPFLDENQLYQQYRFDEPWDGPNNSNLAPEGLPVFRCPADESGSRSDTNYLVVVGPETAWPGARCVRLKDIADETPTTILVVEVRQSGIHWSEPRDLHVIQMAPTINPKAGHGISSGHIGGANVVCADGSARFLSETSHSPASLRALLTIRGGEIANPEGDLISGR